MTQQLVERRTHTFHVDPDAPVDTARYLAYATRIAGMIAAREGLDIVNGPVFVSAKEQIVITFEWDYVRTPSPETPAE